MDSSRKSSYGGRTCQNGHHGQCTACSRFVGRTDRHAHVHHVHKSDELLCRVCIDLTVAAANIVLQALADFGIEKFYASDLVAMARDGKFLIAIQTEIEWPGASRN
jgi:hypothetical protein